MPMKNFLLVLCMMAMSVAVMAQGKPCSGTATVKDFDGNTYNTVQIGKQCWMKENLRTTHYADGTSIPECTDFTFTKRCRYFPGENANNVSTYGYLYNWAAVMNGEESSEENPSGVLGICPTGWHVPSHAEWEQMEIYVRSRSEFRCGDDPEYIAKALADKKNWEEGEKNCAIGNDLKKNNATGFSVLPAGSYTGNYGAFAAFAILWSTTERYDDDTYANIRLFIWDEPDTKDFSFLKSGGFSLRCLRDQ